MIVPILASIAYLVLPGVQLAVYLASMPFLSLVETMDSIAAIYCYFWMLYGILLTLKLPVLQRYIPYGRGISLHMMGSLGVAVLLLFHAFLRIFGRYFIDGLSWALLVLFLLVSILAAGWVRTRLFGFLSDLLAPLLAHTPLASYDVSREFHGAVFAILSIGMYIHIRLTDIFYVVPVASGLLYTAAFGSAIGLYLYAKVRQLALPKYTVTDVVHQGDIHIITVDGRRLPRYRPGQFGYVSLPGTVLAGERHPFSFLSDGSGSVSFAVKALGDHSRKYAAVEPGDSIRINGGFGNFTPRGNGLLCLIGSGIGIVPVLSILKELSRNRDPRRVELFLAVNTRAELLDPVLIERAKASMPGLHPNLLIFDEDPTLFGREYFRSHIDTPREYEYLLCSSETVRRIVVDSLLDLGVKRNHIRFERFTFGRRSIDQQYV